MYFLDRGPDRPEDEQPIWTERLFSYLSTDMMLDLLDRPMTQSAFRRKLNDEGVLPARGHTLSLQQFQRMRQHICYPEILDIGRVEASTVPAVLELLEDFCNVPELVIQGNWIRHSSIVLALSRMALKKITITGECAPSDVFELLLSCRKLSCLALSCPNFIEGNDSEVDALYYSRPLTNLRALFASIGSIVAPLTTLSLPFFGNLEFLHLCLSTEQECILQHERLRHLKITGIGDWPVECCELLLPNLREIEMCHGVFLSGTELSALLESSAHVERVSANIQGRLHLSSQVFKLQALHICVQPTEGTIRSAGDLFDASALQYIAENCRRLVDLKIVGIQTRVVDKHLYGILVNLRQLLGLYLECSWNCSSALFSHPICDNFFEEEQIDVDTYHQTLLAENKLQELHLENLDVGDGFAYALFILEHNYALKRVSLINLRKITDAAIFLLLTSTEVREDIPVERRALYSVPPSPISSPAGSSRLEVGSESSSIVCATAIASPKSYRSNFSVEFFDGVLEEQCMYQLEEMRIQQCTRVSREIAQAFLLAGFKLWNIATDVRLSLRFVEQLRSQRPWIRVECLGEDLELKSAHLSTKHFPDVLAE